MVPSPPDGVATFDVPEGEPPDDPPNRVTAVMPVATSTIARTMGITTLARKSEGLGGAGAGIGCARWGYEGVGCSVVGDAG